ncbi:hypothetical protein LCGC14_1306400 [marine sediment metagenome]|uniref:Uncharacterized protein n=1 Tax=marine sediment metagenome TaxID=412755 RepID=A0A0F9N4U9_9ZZZZ
MKWFNVTIRANASRLINKQIGALETIQSEFGVQAKDALDAVTLATTTFKQDYNMCNLEDLEITDILVEPHVEDGEELDGGFLRRRQAS